MGKTWFQSSTQHLVGQQMVLLGVVSTYWVNGCAAGFPGNITSSGKNKVALVLTELRTAYMTVLGIMADPRTVSPLENSASSFLCVCSIIHSTRRKGQFCLWGDVFKKEETSSSYSNMMRCGSLQ